MTSDPPGPPISRAARPLPPRPLVTRDGRGRVDFSELRAALASVASTPHPAPPYPDVAVVLRDAPKVLAELDAARARIRDLELARDNPPKLVAVLAPQDVPTATDSVPIRPLSRTERRAERERAKRKGR